MPVMLKLAGYKKESIVDGPGIRATVYFQGCPHCCPGCHNPGAQDPLGGSKVSVAELIRSISENRAITGVTFSGGEPFAQATAAAALADRLKALGFNLVIYSGYTYEQLSVLRQENDSIGKLLETAWLLVDGPYLQSERDLNLAFRGSRNQRIIDLIKTIKEGIVVEWAGSDDE